MGKVYAISDLHGRYDLYKQVKDYMGEDDKCFVLGDCVDRGLHGIKIIVDIMTDDRFILIKGNHEQMMIDAIADAEEGYMDFQLWYMNGGYETHKELMEYPIEQQREIISYCKKRPIKAVYWDKVLTHAGFHPEVSPECEEQFLWDRSHIDYKRDFEGYIVHGHTPTSYIQGGKLGVPLSYCGGKKFALDTAACKTGKLAMLDLDTLEFIMVIEEEDVCSH